VWAWRWRPTKRCKTALPKAPVAPTINKWGAAPEGAEGAERKLADRA
jgi:hypothetical protein